MCVNSVDVDYFQFNRKLFKCSFRKKKTKFSDGRQNQNIFYYYAVVAIVFNV